MKKSKSNIIDLAARRAAKKPRRVRCLTILLDEPSKERRPTSMRQATPEEMLQLSGSWNVGPFHRAKPKGDEAAPAVPPRAAKPPVPPAKRIFSRSLTPEEIAKRRSWQVGAVHRVKPKGDEDGE